MKSRRPMTSGRPSCSAGNCEGGNSAPPKATPIHKSTSEQPAAAHLRNLVCQVLLSHLWGQGEPRVSYPAPAETHSVVGDGGSVGGARQEWAAPNVPWGLHRTRLGVFLLHEARQAQPLILPQQSLADLIVFVLSGWGSGWG